MPRVDVTPDLIPEDVAALVGCSIVVALRFHASVTSWIRSEKHNELVGGKPRSRHLDAEAVDLVYDDEPPPLSEVNALAADYGCEAIRELRTGANDAFSHDHLQRKEPRHA